MASSLADVDVVLGAIEQAREYASGKGVPLTVERVACSLGVTREALREIVRGEYKAKELSKEVVAAVKKAYEEATAAVMEHGMMRGNNPVMPIFYLKNNAGYADKVEHSGSIEQVIFIQGDAIMD